MSTDGDVAKPGCGMIPFLEARMTGRQQWRSGERPGIGPSEIELAELERLGELFRDHYIFHNVTEERGVRFIAHGVTVGVRPHTIITDDLAELRDELQQAAPEQLSAAPSRHSATRTHKLVAGRRGVRRGSAAG
jgi:hypothetical protein